MTALPNLFATTAHDHTDRERCRTDVFAPDDHAGDHPAVGAPDLFSTQPLGDDHRPSPTTPLTTDPTAPSWMPELLATVDAGDRPRRTDGIRLSDAFGEEGSIDLRPRRGGDAAPRVVRRRRRNRRHGALRRLRPSWTLATGDATLP